MTPKEPSAYRSRCRHFHATDAGCMSLASLAARRMLLGIILLGTTLTSHEVASASDLTSRLNVQAQTACEAEMLARINAREIFSGKEYKVLTKVARAYGRAVPHVYIFPGDWNMSYIAASTAVDGRGKILVGQQAINRFHTLALKGFLGHEMAHLVGDNAAQGCNDYFLRDPQMEVEADALAARTLGRRAVKAFLEQALVLTEGQNSDAKRRLQILRR
jgi:Zn-dependent protease with chaperone function